MSSITATDHPSSGSRSDTPAASLTGAARPGALVWVPGTALAIRSDDQGRWTLTGLPADGCVPLTVEGADPLAGCANVAEEVDLTSAGSQRACVAALDCPVGASCVAGACRLASDPNPDPDPDPDPVPRSCEDAPDLGGACGPPGLCGSDAVLECGPDGRVVCSRIDGVASECDGFGDVLVVEALSLHDGPGFDLDDRDGDGDLRTGGDNVLGDVDALRSLLDQALKRGLELGDGPDGRYLIEVRPGGLRVYVGVEVEPGVYEARWSFLGDDDVPLGRLPLVEGAEGVLAGPASVDLAVEVAGFRLPLPLTQAFLAVEADAGVGEIGGAVNVASLLGFIEDRHLRSFLDSALSPGDVDTDGDGRLDALSLGIGLRVRRGALRQSEPAGP